MRMSVGVHAGPVYIGTGNLLRRNRKKSTVGNTGMTPGTLLIVSLIIAVIGVGILLWYAAVGLCNGVMWLAWHATHKRVTEDAAPH